MNHIAIITGASRGIGAAIALRLAELDISVALLARDRARLAQVESRIESRGGRCAAIPCDVSRLESIEAALESVYSQLGRPLILVNNAGIGGPFHFTTEVSDEEWDLIFDTNVKSVFWLTRRLLPFMQEQRFGRIVNIASIHGLGGAARSSTYAAAKHAILGYTRSIACEWGAHGITCNAICPGYIDTQMGIQPSQIPDHETRVLGRIPAGRIGTPDEIAGMVAFLVNPQASYINGASLVVDGALSAAVG